MFVIKFWWTKLWDKLSLCFPLFFYFTQALFVYILHINNIHLFFFLYADSKFKYLKHKIEGIDKENFTYSYSVIEGDALMDTLEKISYEIKLTPSPNGGSICKSTCKYHTKGDIEIKEDEIKGSKERASGLFKVVESYLLANPDTYN